MKRAFSLTVIVLVLAALLPLNASMQEGSALRLELSGVNSLDLPYVELTMNVYDALGQPVAGLTADDFTITGPLAEFARDVTVESVASSELPFASVLVIDASESMAGVPLQRAKEAARLFVQTVRPIDPVAVIAFGSTVELLQDFTTDKDALMQAIDSIGSLGRTALYQAADDGVRLASNSPVPRRALILLSDGSEYGGLSTVAAADVITNAFLNGVPGYTIGLGYGAERTFLEGLSRATEARFYESPTPDELDDIYAALAQRLSSQYIVSMRVDVPLDGQQYDFEVRAEREGIASNSISGSVRAPIPVPMVYLDNAPGAPIAEPVDILIDIGADQPISRVMLSIDGGAGVALAGPPYVLSIDPLNYPPGPLTLRVTATDTDGDVGSASATVEIAALPPLISLSRDLAELDAIDEPIDITVNPFGQTPAVSVQLSLNGADPVTLELPYSFTLDPLQLPPGDNHLDVIVANEGGREATYSADFIIADVPPVVSLSGLSDGQPIDAPVTFSVSGSGQTPVAETSASVNGAPLTAVDGLFTLDPMTVAPGAAQLTVTATTDRGQTGQAAITLMIAPLTPIVSIDGLSDGDTVNGDVAITIHVQAQTPANQGVVTLNGAQIAAPASFPATVTLPFSAMQPGMNELALTIHTAAGPQGTLALSFSAPPALFTPTATPTQTPDIPATGTASAFAASTRTAVAQEAADAASTRIAATEAIGTQSALTQAAAAQAQQTQSAATRAAVELASSVTAEALAGQTRAAATEAAQQAETAVAQAATLAPTATAVPATSVPATSVPATPTAVPPSATAIPATRTSSPVPATSVPASATSSPQPTPDTRGTLSAAAALVQEAATRARSTAEMQASATQAAQQTATRASADAQARATTDAANAQATAQAANANATQDAANAQSTAQARATSQANTNQTATRLAQELMTATAQANRTATQQAAETTSARTSATETAESALNSTAEAAAQAAGTASAQSAGRTATAGAERIIATEGAQMTRTARAVLAAQTATAAVTVQATSPAQTVPEATHTPQPTLTPVEAESSAADSATSGLWVIFFIIILLAVALVLWVTRMSKRRFDK